MTTFSDYISRTDAGALIPEDVSNEILKGIDEGSAVMSLATRLPNMSRAQRRMPVLNVLPNAYFVGEKGVSGNFGSKKQTTEMQWANKYINAEEIACIVVIPENTLEDSEYDVWGQLREPIQKAIGRKVDTAMLLGDNTSDVPATWPDGLLVGMPATHLVELGSVGTDLYDDLLAENGVFNIVEEDGFFVNGNLAAIKMRAQLRGLRDTNGQPLFQRSMQSATQWELDGSPCLFPRNGVIDPTEFLMLSGDWSELVYAIRKDITIKMLTEGVITDDSTPPQILFNLGQEDMVAMRVTFRMGWQLPNPVNVVNPDNDTRYPFAALIPATS